MYVYDHEDSTTRFALRYSFDGSFNHWSTGINALGNIAAETLPDESIDGCKPEV